MRVGDKLRVEPRIERVGRRSVTFAYAIVGDADGELRATVRLRHAFVEMAGFAACDVPDAFLSAMSELDLLPEQSPA